MPVIASFLSEPSLQYAAVYALGTGIWTKKAFDAYLSYFAKNAKKKGALNPNAFSVFVPWERDMEKFDRKKAIKVLMTVLKNQEKPTHWVPYLLGRMKAKKAIAKIQKNLGKPDPKESWHIKNLRRQLTKAAEAAAKK